MTAVDLHAARTVPRASRTNATSKWALLLACVATLGCSGSDAATAPATPAPTRPSTASPSEAPREESPTAPTPPSPAPTSAEGAGASADAITALREARALAREERFEDAWRRLSPLVGSGAPPALRCESGYIAFRAGHVAEAMPLVRSAAEEYPVPADRDGRAALARCLYNVGLVCEAAGEHAEAQRAYQRSFSLRANRTVYEHLVQATLRADGALNQADSERIAALASRATGPASSFEELAAGLTAYCGAARYRPENCTATVDQRWPAPAAAAPVTEIAVITSQVPSERYLALRDPTGARLVASLEPRFPASEQTHIERVRFEEVAPPAGPELVFDLHHTFDESFGGGNDCGDDERGCSGTTGRAARRERVACLLAPEVACVRIPTMDLKFEVDGPSASLPCDAPPPALPFGVGWIGEVSFDGSGNITTTARAVASEGVRCPGGDEPSINEVSLEQEAVVAPPRPPSASTETIATLLSNPRRRLERRFPPAPAPATAPPALAFLQPWSPPPPSAVDAAPLTELPAMVASSCAVDTANEQPRCCLYEGRCTGRVATRLAAGPEEVAILEVRCTQADVSAPTDAVYEVLTRGTVGGPHRVIATLRRTFMTAGGRIPSPQGLRFEDVLPAAGLEVRLSFIVEYAEPVIDRRTRVEADSRSTSTVEVLCTGGEHGQCWGLPVNYRGRHLAAGADGRAAVIDATGWRVGFAVEGERLVFTTVEGTPPEVLTGRRLPSDLQPYRMPAWSEGEPEAFY